MSDEPYIDDGFGERMERLCELVGGPGALAKEAGLSRRVIDKYRSGQSDPSRQRLVALAEAGDVSVSWLATGQPPMRHGPQEAMQDPLGLLIDKALIIEALEGVRGIYDRNGRALLSVEAAAIAVDLYNRIVQLSPDKAKQQGALLMALDQLERGLKVSSERDGENKRTG